jgi:hypothetical protein
MFSTGPEDASPGLADNNRTEVREYAYDSRPALAAGVFLGLSGSLLAKLV